MDDDDELALLITFDLDRRSAPPLSSSSSSCASSTTVATRSTVRTRRRRRTTTTAAAAAVLSMSTMLPPCAVSAASSLLRRSGRAFASGSSSSSSVAFALTTAAHRRAASSSIAGVGGGAGRRAGGGATSATLERRFPGPAFSGTTTPSPCFGLASSTQPTSNREGGIRCFVSTSSSDTTPSYLSSSNDSLDEDYDFEEEDDLLIERAITASGYARPTVNWYPGHIAKAERTLAETLKSVDVVIEVRDARAPKATSHPRVGEWSAGRPRVVVLTKVDVVPKGSVDSWRRSYEALGAGRWDEKLDKEVAHRVKQAADVRDRYAPSSSTSTSSTSTSSTTKGGGGSNSGNGAAADDVVVGGGVEDVLFVDARRGKGIHAIHRSVLRAGSHVNERRRRRGLRPRPLRVGVIGYPNVGKSALINRILGRRRAKTADTPGVTRSLQWIRVRSDGSTRASGKSSGSNDDREGWGKKEFELLDSPGIIPANMLDQSDALLLAACNSIGTAAYDNQAVAAYLCEWIKTLHLMGKGPLTSPQWRLKCQERYDFDPLSPMTLHRPGTTSGTIVDVETDERLPTGEDMVQLIADRSYRGDAESAARKILQDFRSGRMGPVALQLAPESVHDEGQRRVPLRRGAAAFVGGTGGLDAASSSLSREERMRKRAEEREERARMAVEAAKERGLELPPMVEEAAAGGNTEASDEDDNDGVKVDEASPDEVGKGLFDGW